MSKIKEHLYNQVYDAFELQALRVLMAIRDSGVTNFDIVDSDYWFREAHYAGLQASMMHQVSHLTGLEPTSFTFATSAQDTADVLAYEYVWIPKRLRDCTDDYMHVIMCPNNVMISVV
jgi:hypothetical protein